MMIKQINQVATDCRARTSTLGAMLAGAAILLLSATSTAAVDGHTFTTDLKKVKTLQVNGEGFLTIEIAANVGPRSCHGNTLRVELDQDGDNALETVALSAMLASDPVMMTVPMSADDCIDGMPTVVELYLLEDI